MSVGYAEILAWIRAFAARIAESKEYLTELDSAIGDADHGINMDRGMQAVVSKLDGAAETGDPGQLLKTVGMTLISTVGGASGPLYGTLFMQAGTSLTDVIEITGDDWADALDAAIAGVQKIGKAERGEKTMLDALIPGRDALRAALLEGASLAVAAQRCADAAEEGMVATIPLVATKGRASYLGERSAGHQDPGATSSHLLLRTAADTWNG
jgi:dihydroxyacetone kinase-like protein